MSGRSYLVRWIGRRGRWAVLSEGEPEPIALYERKLDAVSHAAGLADGEKVPLVIEDADAGETPPSAPPPGP